MGAREEGVGRDGIDRNKSVLLERVFRFARPGGDDPVLDVNGLPVEL